MTMDEPFFSVIVPVYNKEPYIVRAINSVMEQTFKNFELIIVNDASTDNSLHEIKKFSDPRIRLMQRNKPGPGGYAARNLGIASARADWVAFLDADDEWLPEHLSNAEALIRSSNTDIISLSWIDSWGSGKKEQNKFSKFHSGQKSVELNFESFLREWTKGRTPIHMNVAVVKSALLKQIGGFPDGLCKRGGDVATWVKLIHASGSILCSPAITAVYRREDSFVTKSSPPEVQNSCTYRTCLQLLESSKAAGERKGLMRMANYQISHSLVDRASKGILTYSDSKCYFLLGNPVKGLFYRFFSLLPSIAQQTCWSLYRALKRSLK